MQVDVDFVGDPKDSIKALENAGIEINGSAKSLHSALKKVRNPKQRLYEIHGIIKDLLEQIDNMLEEQAKNVAEAEEVHEGGEGLKGCKIDNNDALSGIKFYKGESLVELVERWRFLYKKLYSEVG